MRRLSYVDVILELVDLAIELVSDTRQQLAYYRASVYKEETSVLVRAKVEDLRRLAALMNQIEFIEPFLDHDASELQGFQTASVGECSFSQRTLQLLCEVEGQFQSLASGLKDDKLSSQYGKSFTRNLQKNRRELIAMCKYGSRHWSFFQTL